MARNMDIDADDETIVIGADRTNLLRLRHYLFSAYYDGRFPRRRALELRDAVPGGIESLESAVFRVDVVDAGDMADALAEAVRVAKDEGRDGAARRIHNMAGDIRIEVARSRNGEN